MDRHSSYIFIWLQLELCAMAVLLTKGGCPPAGRGAGSPRRGARGSWGGRCRGPLKAAAKALLAAGEASSCWSPQVATSCLFLEVAAVASRPPPLGCPGAGAWRWSQTSGQVVVRMFL